MNVSGESLLADPTFPDNQDGRIDGGNLRRDGDELCHRRAVHTQSDFAIGIGPFGIWVLHRPLNDTGRHLTGSELVFGR